MILLYHSLIHFTQDLILNPTHTFTHEYLHILTFNTVFRIVFYGKIKHCSNLIRGERTYNHAFGVILKIKWMLKEIHVCAATESIPGIHGFDTNEITGFHTSSTSSGMKYTSLPFEMNTWRDTIPYLFDRIPRITPYRGSPKKRVVTRSPTRMCSPGFTPSPQ